MSLILATVLLAVQDPHAGHARPEEDPHAGHAMPAGEDAHAEHVMSAEEDPHAGHVMPVNDDPHAGHAMPEPEVVEHDAMDHQAMSHGAMEHGTVAGDDIPLGPPSPEAGIGPPSAADAIWGKEVMDHARAGLVRDTSGGTHLLVMADRFELRSDGDEESYLWDAQAWVGGDIDKLWFKTEGEGALDGAVEDASIEALWSHAIGPFFDAQLGVRQDLIGPKRPSLVVALHGLAPYEFEVDASAYLSSAGDLTAALEAELDQRITQRLILQPRGEVVLSAQDIPEFGIGAGLSSIEAGVRLRYEIVREFAPYVGIAQEWRIGNAADFARAGGGKASHTMVVTGARFWF